MDALDLLVNRASQPRLTHPAPQGEALENIMAAALRAPDHACLRPWHFVICEGKGLNRLGELFEQAAIDADMSEKDIERASQLPTRAPMVVIAMSRCQPHEKVPPVEQISSTACAVHAMQMAAVAQGFQGMWRTGSYAYNNTVRAEFNLSDDDQIVGFLYLGTPAFEAKSRVVKSPQTFFEFWR